MKTLKDYLLEAAGMNQAEITSDNPYCEFGFDGTQRRLGWVKPAVFSDIKKPLIALEPVLAGKEYFIFVGMGGSINGIKPLLALFKPKTFQTLDSLDPRALSQVLAGIDDLAKTLVVAISKSGTTQETQLLAATLRDVFAKKIGDDAWKTHFLWLSDITAFSKLDSLGWKDVKKMSIQFNGDTDIGGRFSSPLTLIFFLPLFLLMRKDFAALEKIYQRFLQLQETIQQEAYEAYERYRHKKNAYFSPCVDERLGESFSSWIVQLFQESLGSKHHGFEVKTITNLQNDKLFTAISLDVASENPIVSLFSQMYFFQLFIAFYAAGKKINFVNQEYVEQYKKQMRLLETESDACAKNIDITIDALIDVARKKCLKTQPFIEIVLYFCPSQDYRRMLTESFCRAFPDKRILIFIGSDWNHQSYQAAFGSSDTFYILLTASEYPLDAAFVSSEVLLKNVTTLKLIAKATQLTIKEKAILFSVQPDKV